MIAWYMAHADTILAIELICWVVSQVAVLVSLIVLNAAMSDFRLRRRQ